MFGKALEKTHKAHTKVALPLIPSNHVTNSAGTGLVHIAPSHGQHDFLLALEHKITLVSYLFQQIHIFVLT